MKNKAIKQWICDYCKQQNIKDAPHMQFKFATYSSGKRAFSYSFNGKRWWPVSYEEPVSILGKVD
ncbi:hypothetical protein BCT01_00565 [Vibrio tasmaniensis]|uniref:Uncharacterized protein n=1 Tax=Vibrio tasmaniensis TaxID=212663 RepID=A0A2N7NCS9_9VIBR|nr:hypothetical protein BCT01_00565 [Vibrio tasmaniensis]PMP10020.1 hypothetical protein BCS92_02525 [Vibrio tasmaniensis]